MAVVLGSMFCHLFSAISIAKPFDLQPQDTGQPILGRSETDGSGDTGCNAAINATWSLERDKIDFNTDEVHADPHVPIRNATFDYSADAEGRLLQHLSRNYDKRKRPVKNYLDTTTIRLSMSLYQLLEVNEPEEYIVVLVWILHEWYDEFLTWNPAEFGNITQVMLPWEQVWLSDIVLYNGIASKHFLRERIVVEVEMLPGESNRSKVFFSSPAVYKFNCWLDVYYFPNDVHNCTIVVGSWIYTLRHVDVYASTENVNLRLYIRNQAWDLLSFKAYRRLFYSTRNNVSVYATVQYQLVIQRKPLFFIANLVVPTTVVAWISFVGFFTPGHTGSERTEKVNLGISTCVAMSIFLLIVASRMPSSSASVPVMAWFFIAIIVMVAEAIFASMLVIMIHRQWRFGERIPRLIKRAFFGIVARVLFVEVPEYIFKESNKGKAGTKGRFVDGFGGASVFRFAKVTRTRVKFARKTADVFHLGSDLMANGSSFGFVRNIRQVENRYVRSNQNRRFELDVCVADISEWEILADVVERLFLLLFSLLLVLVSSAMMLTIFNSKQTKVAARFEM